MIEYIVAIFALWVIILYAVRKWGEKYGLDISGPLLLWKTEKGKRLIDRIARKKGWKVYGNIAILITVVAMVATSYLIIMNVIISFQISPESAPSPRLMLGIPGINPIIPIGYGIIALAIAIIVHEFSHGILARFERIKVKALGLVFLIVPVGAFVEPDEEQLLKVKRAKRARVFAAGPTANIVLAVICLLLLSFVFAPSISPKEEGAILTQDFGGIEKWSVIAGVNGNSISSASEIKEILKEIDAGEIYEIEAKTSGNKIAVNIARGIYVAKIVKNSPAEGVIEKGSIIYMINGVDIVNQSTFLDFMDSTVAGELVNISLYLNGSFYSKVITLADRHDFVKGEKEMGKGFLGIQAYGIEDAVIDESYFSQIYNPLKGKFLPYLALPFLGLSPPPHEIMNLYTPSPLFWSFYNLLYWIFWLNFAVGTFNALPAIPLDGGYILKDGINYLFSLIPKTRKRADKISTMVSSVISILLFISVFAIILIPRLREIISF